MVLYIKHYSFIKIIGQGSYGEVWLVKHKDNDNKKFVLKKISFVRASEKEREAARQESLLLRSLNHPNIVKYKDSFEENNSLYIAMAFCEGGDLYTRLKERKGELLSEKQIVEWLIQITMALSYIHEKNILHRDLKTQNVFLTKSIIKIGDLGIAKQLNNQNDMAKTVIGTPYYMSPELFAKKPYNFKSDIWSLGCVTYEMATLKHAFNAKNYTALSYKILNGQTPDMPSKYSKELLILMQGMLNKSPEKRPNTDSILTNPFIRQHIQMFVEKSKDKCENRVRSSKDNQQNHRKLNLSDEKLSVNKSSPESSQQKRNERVTNNDDLVIVHRKHHNDSPKPRKSKLELGDFDAKLKNYNQQENSDIDDVVIVHSSNDSHSINNKEKYHKDSRKSSETDLEKGIFEATLKNNNQEVHDDNDDVVIVHSNNNTHSQNSSSMSSQKENHRETTKSNKTELERELQKCLINEKTEINISPTEIDDECLNKNEKNSKIEYDDLSKEHSIAIANKNKRDKRRQDKRNQGFQTLKFPNSNENRDTEKHDDNENDANEDKRNPRRRRKINSGSQSAKAFKLPDLKRVECEEEEYKNKNHCPDVLQVVEKMNETLNIKKKFENMKDSILVYKAQMESIIFEPIEEEQETLNRSKYLNKRYPEVRKEIMANVGYETLKKCYEVLRNLDLDHEEELKSILSDKYERFCGKIIWLKMVEDN